MTTTILEYDITRPPPSLAGLEKYDRVRVHLFSGERAIGKLTLRTGYRPLSQRTLIETVVQYGLEDIVKAMSGLDYQQLGQWLLNGLEELPEGLNEVEVIPPDFQTTISIVIPTRDRPEDLERCLTRLMNLQSKHPFEIVVSDNNPASGLSEPVARRFPVKYVAEPRPGASYARNAGVAHSAGEIIVFTDDDAQSTPNWLDKLVAPFVEPEIMCVTGLVLPSELETKAQNLFENYGAGGLERGFVRRKLGREFFKQWRGAVQTWQLGGTANCAIRAEVFTRPEMGPFDETLGPGTPAGVGEDTYMFYRILKAGYYCVYEPAALVYHRHRRDMKGLRRQLYSYSKGAVAQQIRILVTDKDRRALRQMLQILPQWHFRRINAWLRGWDNYPVNLVLMEAWANLMGVSGYFKSEKLVRQQGRITAAQIATKRAQAGPLLTVNNIASTV